MPITLYHLAISHYNEKVRWALDLKGIPHARKALIPALHRITTRRLGGSGTTPVLVDSDRGERLGDSTDILRYLETIAPEPALYPQDPEALRRALAIEEELDEGAGRAVRAYGYCLIIDEPGALAARWRNGLSARQRGILALLMPFVIPGVRRAFDLSQESMPKHRAAVDRAAALLDRRLAESGTGYLVGDRFGVADLTAASLFGPAAGPPGSPWALPPESPTDSPDLRRTREYRHRFRETDAGRWVLSIWERHRQPSEGPRA